MHPFNRNPYQGTLHDSRKFPPSQHPSPATTRNSHCSDPLGSRFALPTLELYINGIIQYLPFGVMDSLCNITFVRLSMLLRVSVDHC